MTSIIVPVLDDAEALGSLLRRLARESDVEILVVDGANDPAVERLCDGRPDVRLLRTPAGRALQMNAGAAAARGDWLLFLHADSQLPRPWRTALDAAARDPDIVGGWFRFALDADAWQARAIERLVAWRVRTFRLPYGDQGIFVRRDLFAALGGFHELPLMEDVDFVRRLTAAGHTLSSPLPLVTSARRWQRDGWFRRSARNLLLLSLYFAGMSPERLRRWY